jgi:hypothetical protein
MSGLIVPTRRGFLIGLTALLAAPAIVRATSIMPVSVLPIEPVRRPRRWHHVALTHGDDGLAVFVDGYAVDPASIVRHGYLVDVPSHHIRGLWSPPGSHYSHMVRELP